MTKASVYVEVDVAKNSTDITESGSPETLSLANPLTTTAFTSAFFAFVSGFLDE